MTRLTHAEVRDILPYRFPMLLVDRVLDVQPGACIVATKNITGNEPCYAQLPADAEPAALAYPPTLMFESFGQTAGLLVFLSMDRTVPRPNLLLFGSVADCEVMGSVYPGDCLQHHARLVTIKGDVAFVEGEILVDGREVVRVGRGVIVVREPAALTNQDADG